MRETDPLELALFVGLAGLILYAISQAKALYGAVGAGVQAVQTTVQSGIDQANNTARINHALDQVQQFPSSLVIPGTGGQTAGDLYNQGYTTEDIKGMIQEYNSSAYANQTDQNSFLYQLGQAYGTIF